MIDVPDERPPAAPPLVDPAELLTWVLLDSDRLLAVDKPGWLVMHPSKNGPWSSLGGAIRETFKLDAARFVYRLDRETSGVVILARTAAVAGQLGKAVLQRKIAKAYAVLLEGELAGPVTLDRPLGPDLAANVSIKSRVVPAGSTNAQEAVTKFTPLAARGGYTLAGVELGTGRKHQIRAHAEWLQHRVVGDKLYGPDPGLYLEFATRGWTEHHSELLPLARQALHCAAVDLRPAGLDHLLQAPWPKDLARFAERRMQLPAAEAQGLIDGFVTEKLG